MHRLEAWTEGDNLLRTFPTMGRAIHDHPRRTKVGVGNRWKGGECLFNRRGALSRKRRARRRLLQAVAWPNQVRENQLDTDSPD